MQDGQTGRGLCPCAGHTGMVFGRSGGTWARRSLAAGRWGGSSLVSCLQGRKFYTNKEVGAEGREVLPRIPAREAAFWCLSYPRRTPLQVHSPMDGISYMRSFPMYCLKTYFFIQRCFVVCRIHQAGWYQQGASPAWTF